MALLAALITLDRFGTAEAVPSFTVPGHEIGLLVVAAWLLAMGAVLRFSLAETAPRLTSPRGGFAFGLPELRLLAASLVMVVSALAGAFALAVLFKLLEAPLSAVLGMGVYGAGGVALGVLLAYGSVLSAAFAAARLGLALPAAMIGPRIGARTGWRLGRRRAWALFWILVVALAPSVLADWAFGLVEAATLGPGPLPEPSAWVAPSLAVVTGLLGGFFQAPVYALALAAMFKQVVAERARTAP